MVKILKEVTKEDLENFIYNIDINDSNLYKELENSNKIGIFQISGGTADKLAARIKPESFNDLVAINAMARPGPLEYSAEFYINRKNGEPSPYPDILNEILKDTNYTIIFQEQVMEIFHKIGGFSLDEAENVRGLMKKLGKLEKKPEDIKEWNKIVKKFTKGCINNDINEKMAKSLTGEITAFSNYSFNKCFSADSKIDRDNKARWSPTIEEMYLTKNNKDWAIKNGHKSLYKKYNKYGYGLAFSLNKNNKLYANNIINIEFSGKREIFQILLENGNKIEITSNHKFPTPEGEKSINNGLSVGSLLFVKEEYKFGRIRKNEKSKLTSLNKIIEIKSIGKKNTYNVEMKAPYHTLSVNKIIASNSHAASYSYIAVITLYLSVYFRNYFYANFLANEGNDEDLLKGLYSIRNQGINIVAPDINESYSTFKSKKDSIIFGLTNIKFVGDNAAKKIIENRPYKSFFDFLVKTRSREVNKRVIFALISIGTFDKLYKERKKLLYIFNRFWEEKKSIKIEEKLRAIFDNIEQKANSIPALDTKLSDLIEFEKEFLGFRFFSTPFTKEKIKVFKKMYIQKLIYNNFKEIKKISKKVPIIINDIRQIKDRNGNDMAFIEAEDINGYKINLPIFQSFYKFLKTDLSINSLYLMNLFLKNDQIMFGKDQWMEKEEPIKRLIKKLV